MFYTNFLPKHVISSVPTLYKRYTASDEILYYYYYSVYLRQLTVILTLNLVDSLSTSLPPVCQTTSAFINVGVSSTITLKQASFPSSIKIGSG